mmetsp:Transcript_15056/g.50517  ORF Transcript_15056/g.50517 Transcript_15056/m.50517 type:complete len:373 (+) Transcript_15056:3084-4202(+)
MPVVLVEWPAVRDKGAGHRAVAHEPQLDLRELVGVVGPPLLLARQAADELRRLRHLLHQSKGVILQQLLLAHLLVEHLVQLAQLGLDHRQLVLRHLQPSRRLLQIGRRDAQRLELGLDHARGVKVVLHGRGEDAQPLGRRRRRLGHHRREVGAVLLEAQVDVGEEELDRLLVHQVFALAPKLLQIEQERRRAEHLLPGKLERRVHEQDLRLLHVERDAPDDVQGLLEEDEDAVEDHLDDVRRVLVRLDLLDVLWLDGLDGPIGSVDEGLRFGEVRLCGRLLRPDAVRVGGAGGLVDGHLFALALRLRRRDLQALEHLVRLLRRDGQLLVLERQDALHVVDVPRALHQLLQPELDARFLVLQLGQLLRVHGLV